MASALILENVTISYPIRRTQAVKGNDPGAVLRLAYGGGARATNADVLRNIWLSLRDGDRIAIIGRNGSGKSTLLRTMAGIYAPTTGRIWRRGVVAPIFSASAGFLGQATGYENIYLRGMLLGLTKEEVTERLGEITGFADIGDWLYQPVSTYSSGMALRLAFAITTSIRPNILLLDEWIGAGDALFIQRAQERLENLVQRANILAVASHADALIRRFCTRAIVLERGAVVFDGDVNHALDFYKELVALAAQANKDNRPDTPFGEVETAA
ncbi:MAG: ABC transporter ATP-binding protein [Hyphomonadaceae bacterium]